MNTFPDRELTPSCANLLCVIMPPTALLRPPSAPGAIQGNKLVHHSFYKAFPKCLLGIRSGKPSLLSGSCILERVEDTII